MSIRLTFLLMSGTFPKLTSLTAISFLVPRFMPRITSPKVPLPRLFLRFHRIGWLSPAQAVSDLYVKHSMVTDRRTDERTGTFLDHLLFAIVKTFGERVGLDRHADALLLALGGDKRIVARLLRYLCKRLFWWSFLSSERSCTYRVVSIIIVVRHIVVHGHQPVAVLLLDPAKSLLLSLELLPNREAIAFS